jgi:hypothetical protein
MSEERAHIVKQFVDVLESEGWEIDEWAIEKIVDTSLENKKGLRDMLSRHSAWDEKTLRIPSKRYKRSSPMMYQWNFRSNSAMPRATHTRFRLGGLP